jgi:hypothetical protein
LLAISKLKVPSFDVVDKREGAPNTIANSKQALSFEFKDN